MLQTGQCPKCHAANAYSSQDCIECGARLPWADAVQAGISPASQHAPSDAQPVTNFAPTPEEKTAVVQQKQAAAGQKIATSLLGLGVTIPLVLLVLFLIVGGVVSLFRDDDGSSSGPAAAVVTAVNIAPFTTAQGQAAQIIQCSITNTGGATLYGVVADLTLYDAAGNVIDRPTGQFIYTTYSGKPGLTAGESYSQSGDSGWVHVPNSAFGMPAAARATAQITRYKTSPD